jgi:hypothetical protein
MSYVVDTTAFNHQYDILLQYILGLVFSDLSVDFLYLFFLVSPERLVALRSLYLKKKKK